MASTIRLQRTGTVKISAQQAKVLAYFLQQCPFKPSARFVDYKFEPSTGEPVCLAIVQVHVKEEIFTGYLICRQIRIGRFWQRLPTVTQTGSPIALPGLWTTAARMSLHSVIRFSLRMTVTCGKAGVWLHCCSRFKMPIRYRACLTLSQTLGR